MGSCGEVSCFKVVQDWVCPDLGREVRVKPWDSLLEGGAEVSELISGTGWGGGLGAAEEACT